MNLTAGQEEALRQIRGLTKTHPNGGGIGIISGNAGTGKTTMIRVLAEEHDDQLLVLTPTGKAAVRVREASGAKSRTLHSWMYAANEDEKTGIIEWGLRSPDDVERPPCDFVVVDEASMVTYSVFCDLIKTCKTLALNIVLIGDGFQLPPVEMDPKLRGFSVFDPELPCAFRVNLTEILRQALNSPIIRASKQIREGGWAEDALSELPIILESQLTTQAKATWENEGATICYTNATRHQINRGIRQQLGFGESQLERGEPLLVTQNNYDIELYNGEIIDVLSRPEPINTAPVPIRDSHKNAATHVNYLAASIQPPTLPGLHTICVADREVFGTLGEVGSHCVRRGAKHLRESLYGRIDGVIQGPPYLQANLGYALTCHRAQGSQYPAGIVVVEPALRMNTTDGKKWIYTAITRFAKQIGICWKG